MFEQFNGHDHEETYRSVNLADTSRFGDRIELKRRFKPPLLPNFWAAPGSKDTKVITAWKINSIKFIEEIKNLGPLDYEELTSLLRKHKAGDLKTWKDTGWLAPQGHRVDPKSGRKRTLYALNPESKTRPDVKHADVLEAMKQHEQAQDEEARKADHPGYQGETGYDPQDYAPLV
jgi:hypothetical protein